MTNFGFRTLVAKHFGVQMPKEVPMVAQQRAYTSPIWYTPKSLPGLCTVVGGPDTTD
jgi:Protein of unknown function (DUF3604)